MRSRLKLRWSLIAMGVAAIALPLSGCKDNYKTVESKGTVAKTEGHDEHGDHDDHAGHDHEGHNHEALGPNGGHVIGVEPGHRHVEWVHLDDDATIQVFISDKPEEVSEVSMKIEIQGNEPKVVPFEAAADLGPGAFKVKSPELFTAIMMKEAATVTLRLKAGDAEQTARIEEHDHDHDHKH